MNEADKSKIRGIVKTYLVLNNRLVSTKELLEFINTHNFGLWSGITSRELSTVMDSGHKNGISRDICYFYDKREKQRYYEVK